MKSLPILIALAFVGAGATFAVAHAPDPADAHEDARDRADAHACPSANATALDHANDSARLFHCDATATSPGHNGGAGDDNETDDGDDNETAEGAEHASEGATHANEHAGDHPAARDDDA